MDANRQSNAQDNGIEVITAELEQEQTRKPFILGNTQEIGFNELSTMLTPVFSRGNVETISHYNFLLDL